MKTKTFEVIKKSYKRVFSTSFASATIAFGNIILQSILSIVTVTIFTRLFTEVELYFKTQDNFPQLVFVGGLLAATQACAFLLDFVSSIFVNVGVYEKVTVGNKVSLAKASSQADLFSYEDSAFLKSQERATTAANREMVSQVVMSCNKIIGDILRMVGMAMVLVRYHYFFLVLCAISILPYFIVIKIRGKEFYNIQFYQSNKRRLSNYLWTIYSKEGSAKEMRVMQFGTFITEKLIQVETDIVEEEWLHRKKETTSLLLCDVIKTIGYGISILFSLYLALHKKISLGLFGASIAAFSTLQSSMQNLLQEIGRIEEKAAYAQDFFDFIEAENTIPVVTKETTAFNILVNAISFRYPNSSHDALKEVTLTIRENDTIVIPGENGSGKTTLAKFLLGFYPIHKGEIAYDGIPLPQLSLSSLRDKMSMVTQDYMRYHLSVRDNITISSVENRDDDERIAQVVQEVGMPEIYEFPAKLEEQLGREFDGAELSGGQWQKLAIIRGAFRDSQFVILDEPTSAIDPIFEHELLSRFAEISKGKTTIIISHRVSLAKLADQIIVMKKGRIVETGCHTELIDKNGEYCKLYQSQKQWYQ